MRTPRIAAALSLPLLVLLAAPAARAELVMADSLDWIVADSDMVVRGQVSAVEDLGTIEGWPWARVTVAGRETVKGAPAAGPVVFTIRLHPPEQVALKGAPDVIAFLVNSTRYAGYEPSPPGVALTARRIRAWGPPPVLRLEAEALRKADEIVTRGFGVARTAESVLTHARAAARRTPGKAIGHVTLDAPFDSEAGRALYAGSAVMVTLSVDAGLASEARGWLGSDELHRRLDALKVLAFFQTPEHERLVRGRLADSGFWTETESGGARRRVFAVRKLAWEILTIRWKLSSIPRPTVEEPLPPAAD